MQWLKVFQRKPPAQMRTQDEIDTLREKYAAIDKITDTYAATLKHRTSKMCREMENAFVEKIAPLFMEYRRKCKLATNNANIRELERLLARYTDLVEAEIAAVITIINEHWAPKQLQAAVYVFSDMANEASRRYMISAMIADLGYSPPERVQHLDAGVDAILDEEEENIIDYVSVIAKNYVERVQTGLLEALAGMATTAYIMSQLDEWAGMAERKCDSTAVRVTGTLMSELDRQRARNLDCAKFLWLTMADDRVRDNHKVLHNKTFNWVDGAIGAGVNKQAIWPKTEWGCRCIAVPVFEEAVQAPANNAVKILAKARGLWHNMVKPVKGMRMWLAQANPAQCQACGKFDGKNGYGCPNCGSYGESPTAESKEKGDWKAPDGTIVSDTGSNEVNNKFDTDSKAVNHANKHISRHYPSLSMADYTEKAARLASSPVGGDIRGFSRDNGDIVRYNRRTGDFAIAVPGKDGFVRTLYKVTLKYFNNEKADTWKFRRRK